MTFRTLSTTIFSLLFALSLWNLMHWTSFKDIVVEVTSSTQRSPASVDDSKVFTKQVKVDLVVIDCSKDLENINTEHSHIRFALKNCSHSPKLKNNTTHYESSLWQKDDAWYSDYIPLQANTNVLMINDSISISVLYKSAATATKEI